MKILFLCTGNSCRSQMAEAYARQLLPPGWDIFSAGIQAHGMNPHMLAVMAEDGLDCAGQFSKTVEKVPWQDMDWVITLCGHAAESCPALPITAQTQHWPLNDPAMATGTEAERRAVYRTVRDEIRHRMRGLVTILAADTP